MLGPCLDGADLAGRDQRAPEGRAAGGVLREVPGGPAPRLLESTESPEERSAEGRSSGLWDQGVFPTTAVIQVGISPFIWISLWEAFFVVSQKWSFPTALEELVFGSFRVLGVFLGSFPILSRDPSFSKTSGKRPVFGKNDG